MAGLKLKLCWQTLCDALARKKWLEYAVYAGIGLAALALFLWDGEPAEKTEAENARESGARDALEQKLEQTLQSIKGAGSVRVMVTYETGKEIVPAVSKDTQSGDSGRSTPMTVNVQGGSAPMVLVEKEPVVRGAVIVAEGAKNIGVRLDLARAAMTVLDVSADRVEVFPMQPGG